MAQARRREEERNKDDQLETEQCFFALDAPMLARFGDVHTHLTGMGGWQFWVYEIMNCMLRRRIYPYKAQFQLLKKNNDIDSLLNAYFKSDMFEWYGPGYRDVSAPNFVDNNDGWRTFWGKNFSNVDDLIFSYADYQVMARRTLDADIFYKILENHGSSEIKRLPLTETLRAKLQLVQPGGMKKFVAEHFSADIIYPLSSLCKGFGVEETLGTELSIHHLGMRLGLDINGRHPFGKENYKYISKYLFFDALKQQFDLDWGIANEDLCFLAGLDTHKPYPQQTLVMAQLKNCFSMLNIDGSEPSQGDLLLRYQGHFTPEFYPRRFKLKDAPLSQCLPVWSSLIKHVLQEYQKSGVIYVEFSLSADDLLSPWVYRHLTEEAYPLNDYLFIEPPKNLQNEKLLREFYSKKPSKWQREVAKEVLETHFSNLTIELGSNDDSNDFSLESFLDDIKNPSGDVKDFQQAIRELSSGPVFPRYTFLMSIQRSMMLFPFNNELRLAENNLEAIRFLAERPHAAIQLSLNVKAYRRFLEKLNFIKNHLQEVKRRVIGNPNIKNDDKGPLNRIVGLDLVGDEEGFPYCPFMLDEYLDLASEFELGFRYHCGENVVRGRDGQTEAIMRTHMNISVMAIRRIRERGIPLRIGHGVAFREYLWPDAERLNGVQDEEEINELCVKQVNPVGCIMQDIPIEVNLTSNRYLLQDSKLRQNPDALEKSGFGKWFLCTDDEGIWNGGECKMHKRHKTVSREYCDAISEGYIVNFKQLCAMQQHSLHERFGHHRFWEKKLTVHDSQQEISVKLGMSAATLRSEINRGLHFEDQQLYSDPNYRKIFSLYEALHEPIPSTVYRKTDKDIDKHPYCPLHLSQFWSTHLIRPTPLAGMFLALLYAAACDSDKSQEKQQFKAILETEMADGIYDQLKLREFAHASGIYHPFDVLITTLREKRNREENKAQNKMELLIEDLDSVINSLDSGVLHHRDQPLNMECRNIKDYLKALLVPTFVDQRQNVQHFASSLMNSLFLALDQCIDHIKVLSAQIGEMTPAKTGDNLGGKADEKLKRVTPLPGLIDWENVPADKDAVQETAKKHLPKLRNTCEVVHIIKDVLIRWLNKLNQNSATFQHGCRMLQSYSHSKFTYIPNTDAWKKIAQNEQTTSQQGGITLKLEQVVQTALTRSPQHLTSTSYLNAFLRVIEMKSEGPKFRIIVVEPDEYYRPLPPWLHKDTYHRISERYCDRNWPIINDGDDILDKWYQYSLLVAKFVWKEEERNRDEKSNRTLNTMLCGVGFIGSAIALLSAFLISARKYSKIEVSWVTAFLYGAHSFGSSAFHMRVAAQCKKNLEIRRMVSYEEEKAGPESLFEVCYVSETKITCLPSEPSFPLVHPFLVSPLGHYLPLALHHISLVTKNRINRPYRDMEVTLFEKTIHPNKLFLNGYSLYAPKLTRYIVAKEDKETQRTLTSLQEVVIQGKKEVIKRLQMLKEQAETHLPSLQQNSRGSLETMLLKKFIHHATSHEGNLGSNPPEYFTAETGTLQPRAWRWNSPLLALWKEIFDGCGIDTTIRSLFDLMMSLWEVPENILVCFDPDRAAVLPEQLGDEADAPIVDYLEDLVKVFFLNPQTDCALQPHEPCSSCSTMWNLDCRLKNNKWRNFWSTQMSPRFRRRKLRGSHILLVQSFTGFISSEKNDKEWEQHRESIQQLFKKPLQPLMEHVANFQLLAHALSNSNLRNPILHYLMHCLQDLIQSKEPEKIVFEMLQKMQDLSELHRCSEDKLEPLLIENLDDNAYAKTLERTIKLKQGDMNVFVKYDLRKTLYKLRPSKENRHLAAKAALRIAMDHFNSAQLEPWIVAKLKPGSSVLDTQQESREIMWFYFNEALILLAQEIECRGAASDENCSFLLQSPNSDHQPEDLITIFLPSLDKLKNMLKPSQGSNTFNPDEGKEFHSLWMRSMLLFARIEQNAFSDDMSPKKAWVADMLPDNPKWYCINLSHLKDKLKSNASELEKKIHMKLFLALCRVPVESSNHLLCVHCQLDLILMCTEHCTSLIKQAARTWYWTWEHLRLAIDPEAKAAFSTNFSNPASVNEACKEILQIYRDSQIISQHYEEFKSIWWHFNIVCCCSYLIKDNQGNKTEITNAAAIALTALEKFRQQAQALEVETRDNKETIDLSKTRLNYDLDLEPFKEWSRKTWVLLLSTYNNLLTNSRTCPLQT